MAIQLSDRDMLIFKFIEEHQVLLEKHIAWFISCDEKPVLIRDRLRKLFYLDYLLCERHAGKLPWWSTPTKPLVYMLSPMTRQLVSAEEEGSDNDLGNCEIQRHLLEIANLRMLFLVDQKEGLISDCQWTTTQKKEASDLSPDATVTFKRNNALHRVAIFNHPSATKENLIRATEEALASGKADMIWIVCRDDQSQRAIQQVLQGLPVAARIAFATHQELYKAGVVKAKWQGVEQQFASVYCESVAEAVNWAYGLASAPVAPIQAFT